MKHPAAIATALEATVDFAAGQRTQIIQCKAQGLINQTRKRQLILSDIQLGLAVVLNHIKIVTIEICQLSGVNNMRGTWLTRTGAPALGHIQETHDSLALCQRKPWNTCCGGDQSGPYTRLQ